jgi:Raf kinase inhibitor-like YbhB/YbcL family protein
MIIFHQGSLRYLTFFICFSIFFGTACAAGDTPSGSKEAAMAFHLSSSGFAEGERIPDQYTCKGEDISPPLSWSAAPAGTQEFALICDDPDAPGGTWVHWVLYKIPTSRKDLPEGISKDQKVSGIGLQGMSDSRPSGYGGPCPPPGKDHRYFFKLYALSKPLEAQTGLTKAQLLAAMKGLILGEAQLMGTYSR